MKTKYWISGFPATFATNREKEWKDQIYKALSGKQYCGSSIGLEFIFNKDNFGKYQFDIDNLCEPVFAVLTSSLGWFSGKRTNIALWTARKRIGDEQGLLIYSIDSCPPEIANCSPLFDEVYDGKLPEKATDKVLPSWIDERIKEKFGQQFKPPKRCSVRLQFENMQYSIATISDGKVKPIIDCLYPIIGGDPGAPRDEIIDALVVERVSSSAQRKAVRITVWES